MICPKHVNIETVYGCNASCIMCPIDLPTPRKKGLMSLALSDKIFEDLAPHKNEIEMLDLFGLGEPLLDPHLITRIQRAKAIGFRNMALSTNAELLNEEKRTGLLEAGIDTMIFSIDGIKAETHESIRRKLHFSKVMENCAAMIRQRDAGKFKTKFVVRFIRQESNASEWDAYAAYWSNLLDGNKKDILIRFDAHSWAGAMASKDDHLKTRPRDPLLERKPCWYVFEHLVILADGTVPLCCEDWHKVTVNLGNAANENPIAIFNNRKFEAIRKLHSQFEKTKIGLCSECTVHYSVPSKLVITPSPHPSPLGANTD